MPRWAATAVLAAASIGSVVSPAAATTVPRYNVPASVDATGTRDVTESLTQFLRSVPDGSTVDFARAGRYRIEGTLHLFKRNDLVFNGNGAEFFATTTGHDAKPPTEEYGRLWPRRRAQWAVVGSSGITFRDLTVRGANTGAGYSKGYVPALEAQHAFDIFRSQGVVIERCTVSNTYGDFVAVASTPERRATNILVRNCSMTHSGRQGISVTAGDDMVFEHNVMGEIARTAFDLEPGVAAASIRRVKIAGNTVGRSGGNFVSNGGQGSNVEDITISGNTMKAGQALKIVLQAPEGSRRRNVTVINNVGTGIYGSPLALIRVARVDGVEIRGNHQQIAKTQSRLALEVVQSCRVAVAGNSFPEAKPWTGNGWDGCIAR